MKIWNQDKGVLDTRVTATHEARSGQPAGTGGMKKSFLRFLNQDGGEVRTFGNKKIRKENTLELKG